jgi:hypothetical protein
VQARRRLQQQAVTVGDDIADVVGQPAVREAHVVSALENDDLRVLVQPARAGGARHTGSDTTDNNDLHADPFDV